MTSKYYDVNAPPKTIWDPPSASSSTRARTSGSNDKQRSSTHRRMDEEDRDPIQWSNKAMRVQLWDTFRLARIILGEPIKTQRLTSHLILHAIRKVAEMKLQISMLQREMNDQFFEARIAAEAASSLDATIGSPKITSSALSLETVPESAEAPLSPRLVTPLSSRRSGAFPFESSSDEDDLEDIFDETSDDLEQYQRAGANIKSKPSLDTTNTPTTWGSTVDGDSIEHFVIGRDEDVYDRVSAMRREILSQPSLEHGMSAGRAVSPLAGSLSSKPTPEEYTKLLRLQSQQQHKEIEALLQSLDLKVQETSLSTTTQMKALHAKLADAQSQQAAAIRQQEQRLQRAGGPRPSPTEARSARMAKIQSKRHQEEMDAMLRQLHEKIRATSEHTSEQIQALYETLQHAKVQQETVHIQAMGNLKQQMQEQEQAQKAHLDAIVLKYLQTQEDLEAQLAKTEENLEDQLHLVEEWQRKYRQLQSKMAPETDIQAVLQKVRTLNSHLHGDPKRRGRTKKITMTRSEITQVNQEVIELLSQMVTETEQILDSSSSVAEQLSLEDVPEDLKQAREKEAATLDELDFLKLQKELLVEDTTKVTVEQYAEMTAAGNEEYQKELAAILEAEGHRLQEIDSLEAELTHLAFLAVQIEECERDFRQQQEIYQQSLKELRAQNEVSTVKLKTLQSNVQQVVEEHSGKVLGDKADSKLSAADLRIRELEQGLAERDAQLESTQEQLRSCQDRVRLLETAITSQ